MLEKIPGEKIVLKIISPSITHKSDVGGVKVTSKQDALRIVKTFYEKFSDLTGVLAMEFIEHNSESLGSELMLGLRNTESFGYVVSIGPGGTDAEHLPKILNRMGHKLQLLNLQIQIKNGLMF
jgi:acyl-CoA synthetase (NDP forming)